MKIVGSIENKSFISNINHNCLMNIDRFKFYVHAIRIERRGLVTTDYSR